MQQIPRNLRVAVIFTVLNLAALGWVNALASVAWGQTGVRNVQLPAGTTGMLTLDQNWTDATAEWFYNVPQGSKLLPYDWFLKLEQANSTQLFRDSANFAKYGYLPRQADAANPDGLAVGFVRDGKHLGMTCAACHTGVLRFGEIAYLVDGAPTAADFEGLLRSLSAAMQQTARVDDKFQRFAEAVLGSGASPDDLQALRDDLMNVAKFRAGYNSRNLPQTMRQSFGPGRVDAIGAIFNEVATVFVEEPGNFAEANGPVDYPCLWDTPQHDKVQWNGSIPNFKIPALSPITGTPDVGALGRNAGEVIGVFGYVDLTKIGLLGYGGYAATVEKANLIEIEDTLKTLWSPQWPSELGEIDGDDWAAGQRLFHQSCAKCHDDTFDRTSPTRTVTAVLSPSGTDPNMAGNYATRQGRTGLLEGRIKTLPGLGRFGKTALLNEMLFHVAVLMTLGPDEVIDSPNAGEYPEDTPFDTAAPARPKHRDLADTARAKPRDLVYKARPLNGVWATGPYLHNGSVPNLDELLKRSNKRVKVFRKGTLEYDPDKVGFKTEGPFLFDTTIPGNSNLGHDYGPEFSPEERRQLIAYMKSL